MNHTLPHWSNRRNVSIKIQRTHKAITNQRHFNYAYHLIFDENHSYSKLENEFEILHIC